MFRTAAARQREDAAAKCSRSEELPANDANGREYSETAAAVTLRQFASIRVIRGQTAIHTADYLRYLRNPRGAGTQPRSAAEVGIAQANQAGGDGYLGRQAAQLEAAVAGIKPVDQALADAERRVNELLSQLIQPREPI